MPVVLRLQSMLSTGGSRMAVRLLSWTRTTFNVTKSSTFVALATVCPILDQWTLAWPFDKATRVQGPILASVLPQTSCSRNNSHKHRAKRTAPPMAASTVTWFILLLFWTRSTVAAISLRKMHSLFPKPTCEPMEPCRIGFLGMEFCSCPDGRKCPRSFENSLVYQDIEYQFCDVVKFHECEEGEVAWVKKGLHQIVNCLCPAPLMLHGEIWNPAEDTSQYKCLKKKTCDYNDTCMIRNRVFVGDRTVSLVKGVCTCPEPDACVETGEVIRNRLVELEQDLFKCVKA